MPVRLVPASATPRTSPSASPRRSTTSTATSWPGATTTASSTCRTPFCPHLGAHLGHGGTVEGCEIVCPFHGWKFDAEGANTDIPYSERTNQKAKLRTYPVVERNGFVLAWYHPDDERAACGRSRGRPSSTATPSGRRSSAPSTSSTPASQEMAENGVDSAHFRYVHNTDDGAGDRAATRPTVPRLDHAVDRRSSPRRVAWSRAASTPTPTGPGVAHRPLQRHRRHADLVGARRRSTRRPLQIRFNFRSRPGRRRRPPRTSARRSSTRSTSSSSEDKPIWEHKAHLVRPALADNDGPFMKFRKWDASSTPSRRATSARCSRRRSGPTRWTRPRPRPPPPPATASQTNRDARHQPPVEGAVAGQVAAVDRVLGAGDVAGLVGGEEQHHGATSSTVPMRVSGRRL